MTAEKQTGGKKPMSLAEAHKRMSEHKATARVEGTKGGQPVAREGRKAGDRKGGR